MSDLTSTTNIQVSSISGVGGKLAISYTPERGSIQLYAYDPDDRRKAGIYISLTGREFGKLKEALLKVDEVIESEAIRRRLSKLSSPNGPIHNEGLVSVPLGTSSISLPEPLYASVAKLVSEGKTLIAASEINKALGWISLAGAKEIALVICEHQQALGVRE